MVRYVEGKFNEDYCETLGVNFLEKTISLPTANVVMSLWDLGGDVPVGWGRACVRACGAQPSALLP